VAAGAGADAEEEHAEASAAAPGLSAAPLEVVATQAEDRCGTWGDAAAMRSAAVPRPAAGWWAGSTTGTGHDTGDGAEDKSGCCGCCVAAAADKLMVRLPSALPLLLFRELIPPSISDDASLSGMKFATVLRGKLTQLTAL
jgi:hypothetical protein